MAERPNDRNHDHREHDQNQRILDEALALLAGRHDRPAALITARRRTVSATGACSSNQLTALRPPFNLDKNIIP